MAARPASGGQGVTSNSRRLRTQGSRPHRALPARRHRQRQHAQSLPPVARLAAKANGLSTATLKQHMAAIRMLFDHLVTGGVLEHNSALSVKAPRQKLGKGKIPVLTAEEAGELMRSIETETVVGLRDRALICVMVFTFARV